MYGKNLVTLFKAFRLLSQKTGVSISELKNLLKTSRRTAYRLIDTLNSLEIPLIEKTDSESMEKRFTLQADFLEDLPALKLNELELSKEEITLLYFLFQRGPFFKNTGVEQVFQSLQEKLAILFPERLRINREMLKLDDIFVPGEHCQSDDSSMEGILDDLTDAIVRHKCCIVTYHSFSASEVKIFQIEPLKTFDHSGELYLFARISKYESISILAVNRIKKISLIEKGYEFPLSFYPDEVLESALRLNIGDPVKARIWFSESVAFAVKKERWAEDQSVEDNDDGSIVLTLENTGLFDLKKWVLSFGSKAKVLEPLLIAEEIKSEAAQLAELYKS